MVPTRSVSLFEFVRITDSEILSPDCIIVEKLLKSCKELYFFCKINLNFYIEHLFNLPTLFQESRSEKKMKIYETKF